MNRRFRIGFLLAALVLLPCFALAACGGGSSSVVPEGAETGRYYNDSSEGEQLLILNSGDRFTLIALGDNMSGSYTLDGARLTLVFNYAEDGKIDAELVSDVITLTYKSTQIRFLKIVDYLVEFDSNGGSSVSSINVRNGRRLVAPSAPTRMGYEFLGWYDSTLTNAFDFSNQIITSDVKLYARWHKPLPNASEFTVDFDLNYLGAPKLDSMRTIGGKLYAQLMPTNPTREGYIFRGWFISMLDQADKLSYAWTAATELKERTTLFALWEKDENLGAKAKAPIVSINDNTIRWDAVDGATNYEITIENSSGAKLVDAAKQGAMTRTFDFEAQPHGVYKVTVRALPPAAANYSEPTVRYYANKTLSRVSEFSIIDPLTLLYNRVENATNYKLEITCGNANHDHGTIDNTNQTSYNFSSCQMRAEGIVFRVIASATGYASSVSREFVYNRTLKPIADIAVKSDTQEVVWTAVENAASYIVTVECGDAEHAHVTDNGTKTSYSLKECAPLSGGIKVSVLPKTSGYNSPEPATIVFDKTTLATPRNLRLDYYVLRWDEVEGATSYEIRVGGQTFSANTNSFDFEGEFSFAPNTSYDVSIRAILSQKNSLWSDAFVIRNALVLSPDVSYSDGMLRWTPIVGQGAYFVSVNDQAAFGVYDGNTKTPITLTRAGVNTIKLWLATDSPDNNVSVDVFAYSIEFDTGLGSSVTTQYKALGDTVSLPSVEKPQHTLDAWYTTPGNGGMIFEDNCRFSFSHDIVLFAHWLTVPVEVLLDARGGVDSDGNTISDATALIHPNKNFQIDVPLPASDMGLAVFIGWYRTVLTTVGGQQVPTEVRLTDELGNSLAVSDIMHNDEEAITIYAKWSEQIFSYTKIVGGALDGTYRVTRYYESGSYSPDFDLLSNISIPSVHPVDGIAVKELGALGGSEVAPSANLRVVNIPDSVNAISSAAFTNCTALNAINVSDANPTFSSFNGVVFNKEMTAIMFTPIDMRGAYTIPDGVTEISASAFAARNRLTSITIPASVLYIRSFAFKGCTSLQKVIFAPNSSLQTIDTEAFYGCTSLGDIVLPVRLRTIQVRAFAGTGLVYVTFSGTASGSAQTLEIGDNAFENNARLASVIFGANRNLVSIGTRAFFNCTDLSSINIPNTVTTIGEGAFRECRGLQILTFENDSSLNTIAIEAFYSTAVIEVEIPSSVITISDRAFGYNSSMLYVTFQSVSQITTIAPSAFASCTALREITFPRSLRTIGNYAFSQCQSLAHVYFEGNSQITTIGGYAFASSGVEEIIIPKGLEVLGADGMGVFDYAASLRVLSFEEGTAIKSIVSTYFSGCTALEEINIGTSTDANYSSLGGILYSLDLSTMIKCPIAKKGSVIISSKLLTIPDTALSGCMGFDAFEVEAGNPNFIAEGGLLFSLDEGGNSVTLIKCPPNKRGNEADNYVFTLPTTAGGKSISKMANGAFQNNVGLTDIVIPASYTTIPSSAFQATVNLQKITMLDGVQTIEANAFRDSKALKEMVFSNTLTGTLGASAFRGCIALESIAFPAGISAFGSGVFNGCTSLESVVLPSTLTDLGTYTFNNCSALKNVQLFTGLKTIGTQAFVNCTALERIVIPEGVTVATVAFSGCTNLKYVTLAGNVKLESSAFSKCDAIVSLTAGSVTGASGTFTTSTMTAYLEAAEGTSVAWLPNGHIGFYNCTLSSDMSYVVSFVKKSNSSVTNLSAQSTTNKKTVTAPYREGYTFGGWKDEAGTIYDINVREDVEAIPNNTTLTAVWTLAD